MAAASDNASRLSCVAASQQPRHRHARCSPAGRPSAPRVPTLGDRRDAVAARRSITAEAHLSFLGSALTSSEAFSNFTALERIKHTAAVPIAVHPHWQQMLT